MFLTKKTTLLLFLFAAFWLGMLGHWAALHLLGTHNMEPGEIFVVGEWIVSSILLILIGNSLLRRGRSVEQLINDRTAELQATQQRLERELSDRKLVQEELIASERRFQDSIEISGECIWEFDNEGRLVYLTPTFERAFGHRPEDALGLSWINFIAPDDRIAMLDAFREAAATNGTMRGYLCRGLRADGSLFWMRSNVLPIIGADGSLQGFRGASQDISEEHILRQERERIYQLLQHTNDYVGLVDCDGLVLYANPAMMKLNGVDSYSHDGPIRPHLNELMPAEVWAYHRDVIFPAVLRDGYWKSEATQPNKATGELITLDINIFALRDPKFPDTICFATIQRDITDAKRLEGERQQLLTLLENTEDCVATADLSGKILYTNRSYLRLVGASSAEEARGNHMSSLIPSEHYDKISTEIIPYITANGSWRGEVERLNKTTGEMQTMDLSALRVDDEETGEALCYATVQRDITPLKLVERKLLEYARELEQSSHELQRALEEARSASQIKSEFLATMSHEIRTPMNGVLGMLQLLLETELSDDQRDLAHTLDNSAQSLLRIINDILDFSRIEAGKLEMELIDFPLSDVIEDVAAMVYPIADAKNVNLVCRVDSKLSTYFRGDPTRLRQVLTNLVGNSAKFTESGHIKVSAEYAGDSPAGVLVRFEVEDSGIGVSPEKMAKLFEPFWQADASTTRRYGGSGLGLAICHNLVRLMGGEIDATSRIGFGSSFFFTIPLGRSAVHDNELENAAACLPGLRLLTGPLPEVEAPIIREYLSSWGVEAVECTETELADKLHASQAEGRPFEAAMLRIDHFLDPDGSCHALPTELPVILLVGHARRDDQGCLNGERVLRLPLRRSQLLRALAAIRTNASHESTGVVVHESAMMRRSGDSPNAPRVPPSGINILLAEDNTVNQKVAMRMLQNAGHSVHLASNGLEALKLLKQQHFDMVLMDCQMPEMDGLEATAAIRECSETWAHIPIIAMTANAMRGDRERCLAAGMNDYLSKPVSSVSLTDAVKRAVEMKAAAALIPEQPGT